jgi:hypothetical protein
MKPKKLTQQTLIGQQGINLIESVVLAMGSIWNPTAIDVGIDGSIELCEPGSGHALGRVLFVQSRATERGFQGETDTGFEYLCSERELAYWMQGNAPVLLIVSRPSSKEAYWVSIKDYFADAGRLASRRVRFDKTRDRFTEGCFDALHAVGMPPGAGVYLGPPGKSETLVTNLLRVASYAPRIYVAETQVERPEDMWRLRDERGLPLRAGWILKNGRLLSFHDLREWPWQDLCDRGSVEDFDVEEWAASEDEDRRRDFVWLLKQCLRDKLYPRIVYRKDLDCYIFRRPVSDLKPFSVRYQATPKRESKRDVFIQLTNRKTGKVSCYRHDAFEGFFRRLEGSWYLEINPTYVFTSDGDRLSLFQADQLSRIKRFERNPDVRRQVLMWASQLGRGEDLVTPPFPLLVFGELATLDLQKGIDDAAWMADGTTPYGETPLQVVGRPVPRMDRRRGRGSAPALSGAQEQEELELP